MRWTVLLWLLLPLSAAYVFLAPERPIPALTPIQTGCTPEPWSLAVGDNLRINRVDSDRVVLGTPGAYVSTICTPARLTFRAKADRGGGQWPLISVYNVGQRLYSGRIERDQRLTFDVAAGLVAIDFDDDFYSAETGDRNVYLSEVTLTPTR